MLQEHYYGEWESAKRRYQMDSLLATAVGTAPDGEASAGEADLEPDGVAPEAPMPADDE